MRDRKDDAPCQVAVERKSGLFGLGKVAEVTLEAVSLDKILQAITPFDIHAPPEVESVSEELEKKTGLQRRDVIVEVEGEPATPAVLEQFLTERAGRSLRLKVRKPAIFWGLKRPESVHTVTLEVSAVGQVGIVWDRRMVFVQTPPAQVLPEAIRLTRQAVDRTVGTLKLLLSGNVSPKELGGPILIYTVTTEAAEEGYWLLLKMTAFISVNLAIFNLLPLPVLDGGHLMFLVIEGVRRKPVPPKVAEWVQQAGLVLIIGLMLYVTFNDIGRWFQGFLP
jgi:regulator of sigma E protease